MSAILNILRLAVPHHTNNYRARLLQPIGLFTLLVAFVLGQYLVHNYSSINPGVLGYAANIPAEEVIRITNQKRKEVGLVELQVNSALSQAAREKGLHMLEHDYWAHVAPDGTEPWAFFADIGYKYKYAGENLARDFSNPQATVDAWMASPSHKDNLLSPKYTEIGIAVVEGDLDGVDTTLIVQLFGTPMGAASAQVPETPKTVAVEEDAKVAPAVAPEPEIENEGVPKLNISNTAHISPLEVSKISSSFVLGVLFILLLVDVVVIWQRKVPRNGGRPLAHLSFLSIVFVIILVARAGSII